MQSKHSEYKPNAIQVYDNLKAVRKRPGMYIGGVGAEGIFHLFREIVDNAIDELVNGFGSLIVITILNDQTICVADNGRGVPIGINRKEKKHAIYLIFENLHAGGKFNSDNYRISTGLHGVGAAVVNALSSKFTVLTISNGSCYQVKYRHGGERVQDLIQLERALPVTAKNLVSNGTSVQFSFDQTIFDNGLKFVFDDIKHYCEEKAYLSSLLKFELNDNRIKHHEIISFSNELTDYQSFLTAKYKQIMNKNIMFTEVINNITVKVSFNYYTDFDGYEIKSFANYIATKNGGTHVQGFRQAIIKCITNYIKQSKLLPSSGILPSDIFQGLTAVISILLPEAEVIFEGQTKSKLTTLKVKNIVNQATTKRLLNFLSFNKSSSLIIIKQVLLTQKARVTARRARNAILTEKNTRLNKELIAGKLTKCISRKPEECELFLVEGDSAGGTAKHARSRQTQAILPLKGKILNTYNKGLETVLNNKEVNSLITALECGYSTYFNYDKLRYHKIIIMTDADTDGAHIRALLITLF